MGSEATTRIRHICTLRYEASEPYGAPATTTSDLAIAVWVPSEGLSIFANRQWPLFVAEKHREYITDLLADFEQRQSQDPDTLFQQLCDLHVGPIVAREVRSIPSLDRFEIPEGFIKVTPASKFRG